LGEIMFTREALQDAAILGVVIAIGGLIKYTTFKPHEIEVIRNCSYSDQRVEVDWREFVDCDFTNVTFVYEARGPVRLTNARVHGTVTFDSANMQVKAAMQLVVLIHPPF